MSFDFKAATPDSSITDDNSGLFGADSQTASTPSWYSFGTIKAWINSWLNQPARIPYISGNWYLLDRTPLSGGAVQTVGVSLVKLTPILIRSACHISDIAVCLGTANAGDNLQFALYAASPTTGRPTGSALSSTPNVSAASVGRVSGTLSTPQAVAPGMYWLAVQCSSAIPALVIITPNGPTLFSSEVGDSTLANVWGGSAVAITGVQASATFGTWPDLTAASFSTNATAPAFAYKVSSVP